MVEAATPQDLPQQLRTALAEFAKTPRILVALDFDGTLAPPVDDPELARAIPEARAAVLRLLETPDTRVALVSGRAMRSLENVADLPDEVLLVGSHGVEIRLDSPDIEVALAPHELEQREVLSSVLDQVADAVDEVWIEEKPAGFALHTRLATEKNSRIAHLVALQEVRAEVENVKVRPGKDVLEFSVRSNTKGEAVEHVRQYAKADAVFYAGDDVTDEDVFVALGPDDFGLKSGPGDTAAEYRVAGPLEIAHALSLLADFRRPGP